MRRLLKKEHNMKIFPSLISADLLNLENTIKLLDPHCDGYHIDIMDNHFVPNLTWGAPFVTAIARATRLPLDVHLMVDDPAPWLNNLQLRTGDTVSFHLESTQDVPSLIKAIKTKGWLAGVAISPKTRAQAVSPFFDEVDQITVMTVEPGFSGQKFMPEMLQKIHHIAIERSAKKATFILAADGGVNTQNIGELARLGIDQVAVAAGIFLTSDPVTALQELRKAAGK
jgi:ribulose-phosphate 3-epimerase